jgi:hypothetical protein
LEKIDPERVNKGKIDPGAVFDIMPKRVNNQLTSRDNFTYTNVKLRGYGGNHKMMCYYKSRKALVKFYVVEFFVCC